MYIELYGRGDRLGANICCFIAQILYAVHNNLYIKYNRNYIESCDNVRFIPYDSKYNNSIFIKTLFDYIDIHNQRCEMSDKHEMVSIHFFEIISKVLINIKMDHFSYFKTYMPEIKQIFETHGKIYNVQFNSKTIAVHLRLDDVRDNVDYDGRICASHFNNIINNDIIATDNTHYDINSIYPNCNKQSPLAYNKIQAQINIALETHPDYEVVIITSPNESTTLPYRHISNHDESLDLFLLCNAEVVILSRSTFALSCLYFGIATEVYVPVWGHTSCFGLTTKYDCSNYHFFY